MQKFLRFGALSGGGWLFDSGLLMFLSQKLGLSLLVANFISSSMAALTVYTVSRCLVFAPTQGRQLTRTAVYFCYTCGVIVLASAVIGPVAWALQRGAQFMEVTMTGGQIAFWAKVLITPPQLLANFFTARYLAEYAVNSRES